MHRQPPPGQPLDTAALDAAVSKVAAQIVALAPAVREAMLAGLDRSRNPLDRTIAAEARRYITEEASCDQRSHRPE